jgi:hypothetical protein
LDIEGDVTGQQEVHAPLLPPGVDVTDLAGIRGRSTRTGEIQPGGNRQTGGARSPGTGRDQPADRRPGATEKAPTPSVPGTGAANQPGTRPQPKNIQKDLSQNRPALDPKIQEQLQKDIQNYRANAGIRRVDEPGTPNVPVKGGTVAVARTTIPRLDSKPFGGASAEAIPPGIKGKPGTSGGTVLQPANPTAVEHAEHVALENLRVAINAELQAGRLTRADLVGRRVHLRVEQEPCSSCAAGIDNPDVGKGVIKQFSDRFPELVIEVRSERTSRSYIIEGSKSTPGATSPASQ